MSNNISHKLLELKNTLEDAAFLVTGNASAKVIHSKIVRGLISLSEIEKLTLKENLVIDNRDSHLKEVNKVARKLKFWAKPERKKQINARILNAYLDLNKSGVENITEDTLKDALLNIKDFKNNFDQMKNIAEKNHGKIFEQDNFGNIRIWNPVQSFVDEYEKIVFDNN
ncbi:hypothetical protein [Candidatus Thioglobus sp.]|jgi:hypothetical protein|uniref:hypothetical protein n=1 Tax=Candidatus Thioglobus sp. TaxID=2026721 RepID=UPI0001BD357B|nr:hypothetical protein [Candidatus Thioglobus sp.]EEZ80674.1 MAG: hypothetical protein Sup05_0066 [uncultured Candidatus Thioglobus sp.]MBT3186780.1 hypothetical protein [Candidatus Thioglobus sp.]MBT3965257.1 hypothetical protein [Candidatus Thioglobus sp.]